MPIVKPPAQVCTLLECLDEEVNPIMPLETSRQYNLIGMEQAVELMNDDEKKAMSEVPELSRQLIACLCADPYGYDGVTCSYSKKLSIINHINGFDAISNIKVVSNHPLKEIRLSAFTPFTRGTLQESSEGRYVYTFDNFIAPGSYFPLRYLSIQLGMENEEDEDSLDGTIYYDTVSLAVKNIGEFGNHVYYVVRTSSSDTEDVYTCVGPWSVVLVKLSQDGSISHARQSPVLSEQVVWQDSLPLIAKVESIRRALKLREIVPCKIHKIELVNSRVWKLYETVLNDLSDYARDGYEVENKDGYCFLMQDGVDIGYYRQNEEHKQLERITYYDAKYSQQAFFDEYQTTEEDNVEDVVLDEPLPVIHHMFDMCSTIWGMLTFEKDNTKIYLKLSDIVLHESANVIPVDPPCQIEALPSIFIRLPDE